MSHSIKSLGVTLDCHLPMNNAARLVPRVPRTDHISLHHASLHWLPTHSWIQYKLTSLSYNCPNSTIYVYSIELLNVYTPIRQLRSSSDTSTLCRPSVCTHSLGQRSFSYAAPSVWNSPPCNVRSSNTHMFQISHLQAILLTLCVCVCVCVHGHLFWLLWFLFCNRLCAPIWRNGT